MILGTRQSNSFIKCATSLIPSRSSDIRQHPSSYHGANPDQHDMMAAAGISVVDDRRCFFSQRHLCGPYRANLSVFRGYIWRQRVAPIKEKENPMKGKERATKEEEGMAAASQGDLKATAHVAPQIVGSATVPCTGRRVWRHHSADPVVTRPP